MPSTRSSPAIQQEPVSPREPLPASAVRSGPLQKSRRYLPRSAFGQAIDLPLSTWPLLGVYLEDGRIQIDNNLVENFILRTALGKRTGCSWAMPMRPTQRHP